MKALGGGRMDCCQIRISDELEGILDTFGQNQRLGFFNKFAFDYGSPGRLVSQWVGANRERLHYAHISGVGVHGVGEYADGCWYAVK
jgi:hypothetical protein